MAIRTPAGGGGLCMLSSKSGNIFGKIWRNRLVHHPRCDSEASSSTALRYRSKGPQAHMARSLWVVSSWADHYYP